MLKRIVISLVVLGGLALYISQVELKNDAAQAAIAKPFSGLKPVTVKSLTITSEPGSTEKENSFTLVNSKATSSPADTDGKTVLESEIGAWGIAGIKGADLDSPALNTLFSALQALTLQDGISAKEMGDDKSVYGLAPAAASLKITTANDSSRELTFGKINEYVSQRYVQIDNDPALYLIPSELYDVISKKRDDFRNRLPLIIYEGDVKQLSLTSADTKYVFEQDERWKMTAPKVVSVSNDAINDVFRGIRSVRASEFIDDANTAEKQAAYGLATPELTINIEFKDDKKKPMEVHFGRYKGTDNQDALAVQIVGSDHIVKFSGEVKARVMKNVNDYREKALASFDTSKVKAVVIKKSEATISISRNNESPGLATTGGEKTAQPVSAWLVDGKPGDDPFITGYFETLSKLEAKGFLDVNAQGLGFDTPYGTVELTLADGKTRRIVVGGELPEAQRAIGVDKLSEPFTVDETVVAKILPAKEVFVKAAPQQTSESVPEQAPNSNAASKVAPDSVENAAATPAVQ